MHTYKRRQPREVWDHSPHMTYSQGPYGIPSGGPPTVSSVNDVTPAGAATRPETEVKADTEVKAEAAELLGKTADAAREAESHGAQSHGASSQAGAAR